MDVVDARVLWSERAVGIRGIRGKREKSSNGERGSFFWRVFLGKSVFFFLIVFLKMDKSMLS